MAVLWQQLVNFLKAFIVAQKLRDTDFSFSLNTLIKYQQSYLMTEHLNLYSPMLYESIFKGAIIGSSNLQIT